LVLVLVFPGGMTIPELTAIANRERQIASPSRPRIRIRLVYDLPALQRERNVLRALPCRALASACVEHSFDLAERSTGVAVVVVLADLAGAIGSGAGPAVGAAV
jgi:hypothetical protein